MGGLGFGALISLPDAVSFAECAAEPNLDADHDRRGDDEYEDEGQGGRVKGNHYRLPCQRLGKDADRGLIGRCGIQASHLQQRAQCREPLICRRRSEAMLAHKGNWRG